MCDVVAATSARVMKATENKMGKKRKNRQPAFGNKHTRKTQILISVTVYLSECCGAAAHTESSMQLQHTLSFFSVAVSQPLEFDSVHQKLFSARQFFWRAQPMPF